MSRLINAISIVTLVSMLVFGAADARAREVASLATTELVAQAAPPRGAALASAVIGGAVGLGIVAVASDARWGAAAKEMGALQLSARALSSAVAATLGADEVTVLNGTLLAYAPEAGVSLRVPAVDFMTLPAGDFVVFVPVMSGAF